jgi:hypothetical protein
MSSTSPAIAARFAWKPLLANVALFLFAALSPVLLFEVLLRATTLFDQIDRPTPSYIPRYLRKQDARIGRAGFITEEGFRTDTQVDSLLRKLKSDQGCKVVALGDSFVWGDGLYPEERWTSKLEKQIHCHVYPFGQNGWTSLEYFGYYAANLHDLDFDYLLVDIVSNDPHPRGVFLQHSYPTDRVLSPDDHEIGHLLGLPKLRALRSTFRSYDYVDQITKNLLDARTPTRGSLAAPPVIAYGYSNWERRLYEDDIYSVWESALTDMAAYSRHKLGFLLTPTSNSPQDELIWKKIDATMAAKGLVYVNPYGDLAGLFHSQLRPRSAWANPADAHPGDAQTTLYAAQALRLLQTLGYEMALQSSGTDRH